MRSAVLHRSPADEIVRAFKYDGWRRLAGFMAARMAPLVAELEGRDVAGLVPIPSPPKRERRRGFNPARDLAHALSEELQRVFSDGPRLRVIEALARPEESPRQVGLSPKERRANVRDAFVPDADLTGVRGDLVLIDDVLTTGSTAAAAAEALARGGGSRAHVLTFARAIPEPPDGGDPS